MADLMKTQPYAAQRAKLVQAQRDQQTAFAVRAFVFLMGAVIGTGGGFVLLIWAQKAAYLLANPHAMGAM